MPGITAPKSQAAYDIIVIGSGAGGGQTAYVAAMEGAKVLMLEAGRNHDPVRGTPMFPVHAQPPPRSRDHVPAQRVRRTAGPGVPRARLCLSRGPGWA